MINMSAYDTTVGSLIDVRSIVKAIREAMIQDLSHQRSLDIVTGYDIKPAFIIGAGNAEDIVPFFSHPMLVDAGNGSKFLFTDLRLFIRKQDIPDLGFNQLPPVKNITEFNFTKSRSILSLAWMTGQQSIVKNDLRWSAIIYAMWLGEIIAKKYMLDPKDQLIINIVSYYFYASLFTEGELDNDEIEKIAVHIVKATKAPASMVFDVLYKVDTLTDLESFCRAIVGATENVRLNDFNSGVLLTLIANSWYGVNSRDILAVALEHPPTWCAIVYAAATERSFKNYMVARITDRYGKHGASDGYIKAYTSLVKEYTASIPGLESLEILPFE